MPYTYNTSEDQQAMLEAIGIDDLEQLFSGVPDHLKLQQPLDIPPAHSEIDLAQQMGKLAGANDHVGSKVCFLGGGSYDHFIPAVVDALASRGEFYTSYTPYQAEVSQGNLQAMFEYQTMICQLTGMDVSNASVYDGGSATVEAVLMCLSTSRRNQVVMLGSVHPEYRQIVDTYLINLEASTVTVPAPHGVADLESLEQAIDDQTACVVVQHPNFFGNLEAMGQVIELAKQHGALVVQVFDPISLGLLKSPGAWGADIAVAEGQCLGNPLLYGGPYLGIIAAREQFIRKMPGRIAGQTESQNGHRCYVLTLQTREQHIRRDKATSNICTNQTLFALRASIYLALMGPQGMREVAELCTRKAHFAQQIIAQQDRFELAFNQPFFKEFVVRDRQGNVKELIKQTGAAGYLAGIPLGTWYEDLDDCFLVSVTEKRTRSEIEGLAQALVGSASHAEPVHA